MKKFLSVLLALVLLISTISNVFVFANDSDSETGETVELFVFLSNNPGISELVMSFEYDNTALNLFAVTKGDTMNDATFTGPKNLSSGCMATWYYIDEPEYYTDGTLVTLSFEILDNEAIKDKYPVSVEVVSAEDADQTQFDLQDNISIIDYLPGDVNGDGIHTIRKDVSEFNQYIVDGCKYDPLGYAVRINEDAGDVNNDDALTIKDVILINKYIVDGCKYDPEGYAAKLLPHTEKCIHIPGDEATCTEDQTCTVCGEILVAATGHTYSNVWSYDSDYHWHATLCGHDDEKDKATHEFDVNSLCSVCLFKNDMHTINFRNTKSNSYPSSMIYSGEEGLILSDIEAPFAEGYEFLGWYTKSVGGEIVDYIPKGDTKDYILYAHWDAIKYPIIYEDAPSNSNPVEYTIEQEVLLSDPEWPGLMFSHWTDENGNIVERINVGTTGRVNLTAHYKSRENVIVPASSNTTILSLYDDQHEQYHYIYELGTISNIKLKEYSPYPHNTAVKYTYTVSSSVTVEESIANTVARTIGESVTKTSEWTESVEWANTHSEHNETSTVICPEIEILEVKVKLFEGSGVTTEFDENSLVETSALCNSDSSTLETSAELNSTISYSNGYTKTVEQSWEIDPMLVPYGKYTIVSVCDAKVFAIVTYDPKICKYYLDTYTIISSVGDTILYDPSGYNDVDIVENQGLAFKIPTEKIESDIASSYYVAYDANGGNGNMFMSSHTINGNEKLNKNSFKKQGYSFSGWKFEKDGHVEIYEDGGVVQNLARSGNIVTLYAQWTPNKYNIHYDANKPDNATASVTDMPGEDQECTYDTDVMLAEKPALKGWTFKGWYDSDGNEVGTAGKTLTTPNFCSELNDTKTLYAKWEANTSKITFNTNASSIKVTPSISDSQQTYATYDSTFKFNVPNAGNYYKFAGWYTAASGGTQLTDGNGNSIGKWNLSGDQTVYAHWTQTYANYTYISTVSDLNNIRNAPGANYMLIDDIPNVGSWTPIPSFSGTLDGQKFTISGIKISKTGTKLSSNVYYGMFGTMNGTVKNLTISSSSITVSAQHEGSGVIYAGLLCGTGNSSGKISNVTVTGSSRIEIHRSRSSYGLISGAFGGTIENCSVSNSSLYGNGDTGGVSGTCSGTVKNCSASGLNIGYYATHTNKSIGGIVGYFSTGGTINDCNVMGTTFDYRGSDDDELDGESLHDFNVFGGHHFCSLAPKMGYVVGHLQNCTASGNSASNITKAFSGGGAYDSDDKSKITGDSNESQYYFANSGGKVGKMN